ncbi:MAG: HAD-IC family P-type ATPase [Clostridia bacterium]
MLYYGVLQESKAEKAIDALKKMSLPYIKVKRDNKVLSVKTEELVVGDIVLIEAGDTIPADMRIIISHSLKVEEAALTGESVPEEKSSDAINNTVSLGDRTNMLYSGSSVVYGRGEAIVVAIGMDTELR